MTREEKQKAIDVLKISAPVMAVTQEEFYDYIKTLNKIMNWLEHEPCTDAISRQAAIDACLNGWNKGYKEIVEEIRALPPVTPVGQKVGHWISIGDFECRCSECHLWCYERNRSRYCPSCGAKMQEGE